MNLREQILAAEDFETDTLYVPEWGVDVVVRSMSGRERERFERASESAREDGTVRALLAVLTCYDADGNRIFAEADVPALAAKSAAALGRLFDAAIRLSAVSKEDVDTLEKN